MSDLFRVYLNGKIFTVCANQSDALDCARAVLIGDNDRFAGPPLPDHPRKVTVTAENERGYERMLGEHISGGFPAP